MKTKRGVAAKRRAGTAAGTFVNNGGPVVASPNLSAVFWGPSWNDAEHQTRMGQLEQFLSDLLNSSIMNLLAQYGVGSGSFGDSVTDASVNGSLTDAQIQAQLQTYFNNGSLPEPDANSGHMIFLDENVAVDDPNVAVMCEPSGDNAFGYHNSFTTAKGNPCYYSVVPALSDTCIEESCGNPVDPSCSLQLSDTQLQRITEVTTHEFGEMLSDPVPGTGWTDSSGNEIGDVCEGNTVDITVGPNTWRVQTLWDNAANACDAGNSTPVPTPPPPVPLPPPPGNTWTSADQPLIVAAFYIAKAGQYVQTLLNNASRVKQLEKENAELKRQISEKK